MFSPCFKKKILLSQLVQLLSCLLQPRKSLIISEFFKLLEQNMYTQQRKSSASKIINFNVIIESNSNSQDSDFFSNLTVPVKILQKKLRKKRRKSVGTGWLQLAYQPLAMQRSRAGQACPRRPVPQPQVLILSFSTFVLY